MSDDVISKIKDRVDVVDLISSYLRLQKSGVNYKARCPFHNEKSGSFFVSPERQIWHCFGCGIGGDVFGFVKQIEGVEFPEALRILAARAGVELTPFSPEYKQFQSAKTKLYEISELATKLFEKQLHQSAVGKNVMIYLHERGLTDESIKTFRIGFAPDSWNFLTDFLTQKYSAEEVLSAGLIIKSEKAISHSPSALSRYYDRFRSRIMFPICDINGQVTGFSGRVYGTNTSEDTAKYVNTPQTSIYDKSRILYGLDKAKLGIRQDNKCIVVEGNMDVVMSHQAGVENVVASSGTALTDGHLKIIKRYTDNLDLCFDADSAGEMATARGVDLALAGGFNVGIIAINEPGIKDPADFVQKKGAAWAEFAKSSRPFLEVFFETAKKKFDISTALGKKLLTQKLLPFIAVIANNIEQAHWIGEISLALHLKEDVLRQELALMKPQDYRGGIEHLPSAGLKQETNPQRLNMLEESLLSLVVKKPELAANLNPENEIFISENCRRLIRQVGDSQFETEEEIVSRLISANDVSLKMSLDIAYLKSQELWKDFEDMQMEREFDVLIAQAKKHYISAQLQKLEYEIKTAEKIQDRALLSKLMIEFSKVSKELGN